MLLPGNFMVNLFQDHMRKAGDVCFAEVSRDSEGMPYAKYVSINCFAISAHVIFYCSHVVLYLHLGFLF